MTQRLATIGSISHGTLRLEDLCYAFAVELDWLKQSIKWRERFYSLCLPDSTEIHPDARAQGEALLDDLIDRLSQHAPAYCYFGTHPGDGSDWGFWPHHEAIAELPVRTDFARYADWCFAVTSETTLLGWEEWKLTNGGAGQDEDFKTVNDHGNVTVWSAHGKILLELV
jgi:hypothetical protein